MIVVIEGSDLPGRRCAPNPAGGSYENVHVGICNRSPSHPGLVVVPPRPWSAADVVIGDAEVARWQFEVGVRVSDGTFDFAGPFVLGKRGERHFGLAWGEVTEDSRFRLFRAAKLRLNDIAPELVREAAAPDRQLVGRLGLTDAKGHPRCASVRPPDVSWSVAPAVGQKDQFDP